MKRLRNDADREKADKTYIAKLNTMDSLWLFIREFFGCLPDDDPFSAPDMITRWYVIGKKRFEAELNIEKLLKTLRSLKIHTNLTREAKAKLSL